VWSFPRDHRCNTQNWRSAGGSRGGREVFGVRVCVSRRREGGGLPEGSLMKISNSKGEAHVTVMKEGSHNEL
jgi:hypothetical protein